MESLPAHHKSRKSFNVLGQAHEITFSCHKRQALLAETWEYETVIKCLDRARAQVGFQIWAYALMPNHVHLLILPTNEQASIARILHAIKRPAAQRIIERWKEDCNPKLALVTKPKNDGHLLWMPGGGYDRNLTSDKAIRASIDYIHGNPGKKGLVSADVDWPWSSAGAYAGLETSVLSVDPCPCR